MRPRTIVVGDLHGCSLEFDDLLTAVRFRFAYDRLVLVGDLVARGPDSRGVVARAMAYGALAVRGNHDEKVLQWWRLYRAKGRLRADLLMPLNERHQRVVDELSDAQMAWLDALPLRLPLPEHRCTVVHAGVDPSRPIEDAPSDVLLSARSVTDEGKITRKLEGTPWAKRYRGPEQLVFGHDARRNLQLEAFATGLDTGCCYGRALTAVLLDEGEALPADLAQRRSKLVAVPARRAWCPPGTGDGPE